MDSPSQPVLPSPATVSTVGPGELDLFKMFVLLRANLRRVVITGFIFAFVMGLFALWVPPRFSATASVIIPQSNPSAAGLALQAAVAGLDLIGGGNEIYLDILHSRSVTASMVQRYDLVHHYHAKDIDGAIGALMGSSVMAVTKEGLLTITVTDTDPKMAATLANAYFPELDAQNRKLSFASEAQQRSFYEGELSKENDALTEAEATLQKAQQKTGAIDPTASAQVSIGATESVRAQLRLRQIELNALLQSATQQNPQVQTLQAEIGALQGQLHQLESTGGSASGIPTSQLPATVLSLTRAARDVKFHESLYGILERQLESVKQQENKNYSQLEMLDPAEVPKHKSWPPRTLYVLIGFFVGALLALVYVLVKEFLGSILQRPENRARYQALLRNTSKYQAR